MTPVPDYIAGARALLAATRSADLLAEVERHILLLADQPDSALGDVPPSRRRGHLDAAAVVGRYRALIADPAVAAPATADAGLRERYAAALHSWLNETAEANSWENLAAEAADAVLAVRDRRMEQLAAGRETWKVKAEEIERGRDRIAEELAARMASQRRVASERDKALKAFNAVTLELWDAQSDRDIAENARAQAEKRVEIVERLNRNQADTIARVRDLTGRWAKRTDQLKRAAELLDDALDGPEADHA